MSRVSAKRTIWTSFLVDGLDIGLNVTMMIITGSVVVLAEALEGASDLVASGLLLIGLGISKKRSDKAHPFGFGKALFSWTLLSAMVMLVFGAGLSFYFGLKRFLDPHEIDHIGLAFLALGISIVSNGYAMSVSTRRLLHNNPLSQLYQIFKNTTHVETKNTFILDFTGTSAALIGMLSIILYQLSGKTYFDGLGSMLMGLVIAVSSIFLIWGVKDFLSGKGASPEIIQQIKNTVLAFEEVKAVTEISTMYLGSEKLLLHLDIEVDNNTVAKKILDLTDDIKKTLKREVRHITNIQIEINRKTRN